MEDVFVLVSYCVVYSGPILRVSLQRQADTQPNKRPVDPASFDAQLDFAFLFVDQLQVLLL